MEVILISKSPETDHVPEKALTQYKHNRRPKCGMLEAEKKTYKEGKLTRRGELNKQIYFN